MILSERAVRKILKEFGLTEKEMDIYIFLAKQGILKGGDLAKQTKTTKALVYRILRSLQAKGIVESTVEFPARFSAVPFENVIDLNIKSKLNDVARIKEEKNTLLTYWKGIDKPKPDTSVEKFALITGKQKIFHKQAQLLTKTKSSFSIVTTSQNLAQADYFGVFDQRFKNLPTEISFRFLIEAQNQNLTTVKKIFKQIEAKIPDIYVRVPKLGLGIFPQMTIRDNEEALFQIADKSSNSKEKNKDLFLWTNCKSLIEAFSLVFEELWSSSTGEIAEISDKLQTGNFLPQKIQVIDDSQTAYAKYRDKLQSAKKEIIMILSSDSPLAIEKTKQLLNIVVEKDVAVRLMFSVTSDNKDVAQELLKKYRVRHVPVGYLGMTLIDDKHFFQFKSTDHASEMSFEKTFYTNDNDYVIRTKKMLNDMWEQAQVPSVSTLKSILQKVDPMFSPFPYDTPNLMGAPFVIEQTPPGTLTEKDILQKMVEAKRICSDTSEVIDRRFGSMGLAVIHPPKYLKLPEIMIIVDKIEKSSSLGEEDAVIFLTKLKTTKGYAYIPVAIIGDNPRAHDFWKKMNICNPAGQNTRLIKKDEIEIKIHGNTLFAGWTVPISLYPPKLTLPPSCILIEGYGDVKTTAYTVVPPPGYEIVREENYLDAFVTFFHPASKYSGPGTDGYLIRDSIITIYPPKGTV